MKHWQGWVAMLLLLGVPAAEVAAKSKVEREEHIILSQSVAGKNGSANPLIALEPSMIMGKLDHTSYMLPNSSYYNIHAFEGIAGQSIIIDLTSTEIDPYLLLLDSEGNVIAEDEDGGSGQDARIVITLEQTGLYRIIASSGNSLGWGNYTLTWREASPNDIFPEQDESDSDNLMPLSRFSSFMSEEPIPIDILLEDIPYEYRNIDRTFEESMELLKDPSLLGEVIEIATSDLATARASNNRTGEMEALANLGFAYDNLEDYAQALDYYQQALSISQELKNRSEEARFLYCLGLVYQNMGDDSRALEFYQQSTDIERAIGDSEGLAGNLSVLGYTQDRLGLVTQQIDSYEEALAMARANSDRTGEAVALAGLGKAYFNLGQYVEAESYLMDAINIFEAVYLDESLSPNPGGDAYADADTIYLLDGQIKTYSLLQQTLIAQNKTNAALEVAERGRAQVFKKRLWQRYGDNGQSTPPPPTLADIQQVARTQNATLVEYSLVSDETLYIWVIKPTGEIDFRSVNLADKTGGLSLAELVDTTRFSMGVRGRSAIEIVPEDGNIATATSRLQQLHQLLIEPIANLLPKTPEKRVIFVPHSELFLLPFPALQDANGIDLIDKHTILTAPAIQVLQLSGERGETGGRGEALVVGNPVMPSISLNPGDPPVQLSSLPGAQTEAKAIAQLLGTEPLLSNAATEPAVTARMQTASIVHLATHGILDDAGGMGSSIALTPGIRTQGGVSNLLDSTDGVLTAGEILGMNLNADLVVLSACDTGRGKITGDGVVGLSRSLVTAGAQSVVVSLWKVPDDATAMLMTQFYENLQQGLDKATALRNAMLETRATYPDPVDWAAFTLIGEI